MKKKEILERSKPYFARLNFHDFTRFVISDEINNSVTRNDA